MGNKFEMGGWVPSNGDLVYTLEVGSSFSCMQENAESCLCVQSASLCLFIDELSLLMLRDINTNDCSCYFSCYSWYYVCVVLYFCVCCGMINFLCFHG
jgi:hypothetical protein